MPVKKNNKKEISKSSHWCVASAWCSFTHRLFVTFIGILLVYFIVYLGVLIRNETKEYHYIGLSDRAERSITIEGQGKVTAKPDIAMTTMGVIAEAETVAEAQAQNTVIMNQLLTRLKDLGVADEDIQTANYNIYPRYDYLEDEGRVLQGYEVSQNVSVKIREIDKANQVIALAGEVGATNVSGLQFTIDDREIYLDEARELALEKVGKKAKILADQLGVYLLSVSSYDEYEGSSDGMDLYRYAEATGLGGGAPQVEVGSEDVVMNVRVSFEIR